MRNSGSIVAIVILELVLLLVLSGFGMMGFGGFGMGPGMMGGYGMMGGFGYNPLGAVLSLVFWALIIAGGILLVVWLVRNYGGRSLTLPGVNETPLEILKARYARGEITKEQFDEIRRDLAS